MAPPTRYAPIMPRRHHTKEEWTGVFSNYFEVGPRRYGSEIWEYTFGVLVKNGDIKENPPGSGEYSSDRNLEFERIMNLCFKGSYGQVEDSSEGLASKPSYLSDSEAQSLTSPAPEPEPLSPPKVLGRFTKGEWMKKIG